MALGSPEVAGDTRVCAARGRQQVPGPSRAFGCPVVGTSSPACSICGFGAVSEPFWSRRLLAAGR